MRTWDDVEREIKRIAHEIIEIERKQAQEIDEEILYRLTRKKEG